MRDGSTTWNSGTLGSTDCPTEPWRSVTTPPSGAVTV